MGEAFKLECDACHYKDNMFVGIGFAYMSLKSIASFVKDPILKQRIEQFMKDDSAAYNAYEAVFVCPACGGLQNELYIEMRSDTSHYKHICHCHKCGAQMEEAVVEHNVPIELQCPDCHEGKLKATFYMDWD